jgi:signal transduction histidine kinase
MRVIPGFFGDFLIPVVGGVNYKLNFITSTPEGYATVVSQRVAAERLALAARWLERLNELLIVGPNEVFPSDQLLDHIPALIAEIATYLRAPDDEEIAANAAVIDKARELGILRHAQRASVHQLLREYELLSELLEAFVVEETLRVTPQPTARECFEVLHRLTRATRTLMRTTVDTFVSEYTTTIQERSERIKSFNRMASHELRSPIGTLMLAAGAKTGLSARGDGGTALVAALFWGHREVVTLLGVEPRNLRVAAGLGRVDLIAELAGTPAAGAHRGGVLYTLCLYVIPRLF